MLKKTLKTLMIKAELNIAPNDVSLQSNSKIVNRFNRPRARECAFGVSFKPRGVHCFVLSLNRVINKVILNSSLLHRGGLLAKTE